MSNEQLTKVLSGKENITYAFLMSLTEEEITECRKMLADMPDAYFAHKAFDWLDLKKKRTFNKLGFCFVKNGNEPCFYTDNIPFGIALVVAALLLMVLTIFNKDILSSAISICCAISCIVGLFYSIYDCERLEWKVDCIYDNFYKCKVHFTQDHFYLPSAHVYIPYSCITHVKAYNKDLCLTCGNIMYLITFNNAHNELPAVIKHIQGRMVPANE